MTRLGTWQPRWKQHYCRTVRQWGQCTSNTHGRKTLCQKKKIHLKIAFSGIHLHSLVTIPSSTPSREIWKKACGGDWQHGASSCARGNRCERLNEFNSNRTVSFQGFPISTELEGQQPYTITHFPTGHISPSCMSPHTLPMYPVLQLYKKIKPNHF